MQKPVIVFAMLCVSAAVCVAGPKQTGTVLSQTSVACGEKKSKKQSLDLMCHEYVIRGRSIDYTVRQSKPEDKTLIPLNATVEFKLNKSKMKVKTSDESYEFLVISQAAASAAAAPAAPSQK